MVLPAKAGEVKIGCYVNGSFETMIFEFFEKELSRRAYNKIIDYWVDKNAYGCIGLKSLEKINYEPFPCPIEGLFGCRKNDPIIYDNCLLDELKGIQNLERSSAIQARDLASKKCLGIAEAPSILQKWKYKN